MDESRWWPAIGLLFGTALGFAVMAGGLTAFLVVLVLGVIGFLVGRAMSGELDMSGLLGGRRRT
ncbi:hypothetical protein [Sphaerisporangium corydalis]|uniref:DUF2273 domain-containing protein n=1 Tax=Sphaerisporangium corydalis TaxID=1441875 RepID=A0ABV9EF88_9ACTN|nr:hypothetical protein [Sphaerisporangium corydalis]